MHLLLLSSAVVTLAISVHADTAETCDLVTAIESYSSAGIVPHGASCTTYSSLSDGTGVSCHWEFPYRDDAATRHASKLWTMLQNCRDGMRLAPDRTVNHPDSYELREWAVEEDVYGVSLKDKGARLRTFVFFRFVDADNDD